MTATQSENKPWRDEQTLRDLYLNQELSAREISEKLDCGRRTVTNWLYRNDIKSPSGNQPYHNKQLLEELYFEEDLSIEEIAEKWDCAELTVRRWMMRHNLSKKQKHSDAPWRDEERLDELYSGLGLTMRETGDILGCSHDCIRRWLQKFDINITVPRYREWSHIKQLRSSDELTVEDIAEDLDVSLNVIERQNARYQNEVVKNQPAPQHQSPGESKPWHDEDKLHYLFKDENLSAEDIADKLGCSTSNIHRWLRTFGIVHNPERPWTNEELLKELYIEEDLSTYEIGDKLGCASTTVMDWINKFDISRKGGDRTPLWQIKGVLETLYLEKDWKPQDIADEMGCHRSTVSEWLTRHGLKASNKEDIPYQDKEILERMYVKQEMATTEIAEKLDCSHKTVSYWLARHEIPTRTPDHVTHQLFGVDLGEEQAFKNERLLQQLYVEEGLSVSEIASELDCSNSSVRTYLQRYGIQREIEEFSLSDIDCEIPDEVPWRDESLMTNLYIENDLTVRSISSIFDCSTGTISNWLDEHGISKGKSTERPSRVELRQMYEDKRYSGSKIAGRLGVSPSTVYRWLKEYDIEVRDPGAHSNPVLNDEEEMRRLYVEKELSISEIETKLGAHSLTVRESLDEHEIEVRPAKVYLQGENSPFWKGGQAPYGKGWTAEKREEVLDKYDYLCQSCGMTQEEHKEKFSQSLHIHHVMPAGKFEDPEKRNSISNLVPMCSSCHTKWEGIPLQPTFSSD